MSSRTDYLHQQTRWNVNDANARHNRRNDTPDERAKRDRIMAEIAEIDAKREAAKNPSADRIAEMWRANTGR